MKKISQEKLNEKLRLHELWLNAKVDGVRLDLRDFDLRGSDLNKSDLRFSDLSYSDLKFSDLSNSNLRGSNLKGSDLRGSNLSNSNLRFSDLSNSGLRGSDLRDSDLSNSIGNGKQIKSLQIGDYNIVYTFDKLFIGCKGYLISDWQKSNIKLYSDDLLLWNENKDFILEIIKRYPAIKTEIE
jgi:hypothetical protein